jgi:hypothetical protein
MTGQKLSLQFIYFVLFIANFNIDILHLVLLVLPYLPRSTPSDFGIYRIVGQVFLFPVDITSCPFLSAIVPDICHFLVFKFVVAKI